MKKAPLVAGFLLAAQSVHASPSYKVGGWEVSTAKEQRPWIFRRDNEVVTVTCSTVKGFGASDAQLSVTYKNKSGGAFDFSTIKAATFQGVHVADASAYCTRDGGMIIFALPKLTGKIVKMIDNYRSNPQPQISAASAAHP